MRKLYQDLYAVAGNTEQLARELGVNEENVKAWKINEHVPTKFARAATLIYRDYYLRRYGRTLLESGYPIIPILPNSKVCNVPKWQNMQMVESDILNYDVGVKVGKRRFRYEGIGIRCSSLPGVDIDIEDEKLSAKMVRFIENLVGENGVVLKRYGRGSKVLIPFRIAEGGGAISKVVSDTFIMEGEKEVSQHKIEILGKGQYYVAFGTHPDTEKPYSWLKGESILTTNKENLPILTLDMIHQILEYFNKLMLVAGYLTAKEGKVGSNEDSDLINVCSYPVENLGFKDVTRALDTVDVEDRELWIKAGMALHHQYEGRYEGLVIWDTWSQKSAKYVEDECEAKWEGFKSDVAWGVTFRSILKIAKDALPPGGDIVGKTFVEEFYDRYILSDGEVIDSYADKDKPGMKISNFRVWHADAHIEYIDKNDEPQKIPLVGKWIKDTKKRKVVGRIYKPGSGEIVQNDTDGMDYYNTFWMPKFDSRCNRNLKRFWIHMRYLFPVKEEREWFLDWMAFNVQKPNERSPIAPLHVSRHQGTGRGWLVLLLRGLVGTHNVSKTTVESFTGTGSKSQFNGYLYESLICVIEEIKISSKDKYAFSDTIKTIITDEVQDFNIKGRAGFTDVSYTNFFFMSNHKDAVVMREEDRRMNVFFCDAAPKDSLYYGKLYEWLGDKGNIASLFNWLKERKLDLAAFRCQKVMETSARSRMISDTTSELEREFNVLVAEEDISWVTVPILLDILMRRMETVDFSVVGDKSGGYRNQLMNILKSSTKTFGTHRVRFGKKMVQSWCLNGAKSGHNSTQIKEEIERVKKVFIEDFDKE